MHVPSAYVETGFSKNAESKISSMSMSGRGLLRIREAIYSFIGVLVGTLVDLLVFSLTFVAIGWCGAGAGGEGEKIFLAAGGIILSQWVGALGGIIHDLFFRRMVGEDRHRGQSVGGGPKIWVTGLVLLSGPGLLILGYLTSNIWVAKLSLTAITHSLVFFHVARKSWSQ